MSRHRAAVVSTLARVVSGRVVLAPVIAAFAGCLAVACVFPQEEPFEEAAPSPVSAAASTGAGGEGPADDPFEPGPGGVRRLLPAELQRSVEVVLGAAAGEAVVDAPVIEPLHGFASIGAAEVAMSPADVGRIERIATDAASATLDDPTHLIAIAPCAGEDEPDDGCWADVARDVGLLAWRRPLEQVEIDRLVAVAGAGAAWSVEQGVGVRFEQGLKYELMAMLQSPNFLYLVEVGTPDPEDPSRRVLSPYELAARISFFIQGRTPERGFLQDVALGILDTPEGVRQATRQLLKSRHAHAKLDAFFDELLFLDDLANISKEPEAFPEFDAGLAASMKEETRHFMRDLVWERDADLREMFTSQTTFVDRDLARLYGVEDQLLVDGAIGDDGDGFRRVVLPPEQERAGILGQASFLARFSHPGVTSPTRRGNYVTSRFLCDEVPPPPPGVVPVLPEDPGEPETLREKLARHATDPTCASCHTAMDPIGLAFEHFDPIGKYREQDRGLDLDVTGDVVGLGAFSGPRELGQRIADDDRMPDCIVASFVRSSLGHIEEGPERYALRDLSERFVDGGYRVQDLLIELTASPLFRYVGAPK